MSTVYLVLCIAGWILGWVLVGFIPRLPRTRDDEELPLIDVVIPARNEATNLPNILGDLAEQRLPGMRVVVVDDHSDDGTGDIARSFDFVEVVPAPDLPDGWTGKNWACHTGARHEPRDGVLVFLDADIRLHGDALARTVAHQTRRRGLVSVWPYHAVKKPYEHLSALFNVIALAAVGCGSLVPMRRRGALGPLLVTDRSTYERLGGHDAIKGCVVDDYELGLRYGDAGEPVDVVGGHDDVSFRMYPGGLGDLVEGWTKNAALGAGSAPLWRFLAIVVWIGAAGWWAFVYKGGPASIPSAVLVACFAVQMFVIFRQIGRFGFLTALLYPLVLWFTVLVFLRSHWKTHVRGRVTWRGREISTKRAR